MHINDYFPAHAAIVTPDDVALQYGSMLYVGGAGNISLDTEGGELAVVFTAVPAGTYLKVRFRKVNALGISATNLKRMWQ